MIVRIQSFDRIKSFFFKDKFHVYCLREKIKVHAASLHR